MDSRSKEFKSVGNKRVAVPCNGRMENMREHPVAKAFSGSDVCAPCHHFIRFLMDGNDPNVRDTETGETFLHILCDEAHTRQSPSGVCVVYVMSTKIDLDITDIRGDTLLHKVVLIRGAWRWIVAFMRCGADPFVKNKAGRTAEQEILFHKREGWEENLHWLRKFLPGLWAAVKSENPDLVLVEKLLKCWCRTTKIVGHEALNLKVQWDIKKGCERYTRESKLDMICLLEKYENTNELALAMLCNKVAFIEKWASSGPRRDVDLNSKDFSYQYWYRDYPTAPRPLVMAVWEVSNVMLIRLFLGLSPKPDLYLKYTFESQATSPPKPLFFHVFNPKLKPANEEVTVEILKHVDLSVRNVYGQTALMEAILNGETTSIIQAVLEAGVDLAARDAQGRTARDHCDILNRLDYKSVIDGYVAKLIETKNTEKLKALVLHMYDLSDVDKPSPLDLTFDLAYVNRLFYVVKAGNKALFVNVINDTLCQARDKAGRSLLHFAIQCLGSGKHLEEDNKRLDVIKNLSISGDMRLHSTRDQPLVGEDRCSSCFGRNTCTKDTSRDLEGIIMYLITNFPSMLHSTNNLGQSPLHIAHIYSTKPEIIRELEKAGAPTQAKDVFDFVPRDYCEQECGSQMFLERCKPTFDLDLDTFLGENNFEENFRNAVKTGEVQGVMRLMEPLLEHNGEQRFSTLLFDCLDQGHISLTSYLIQTGFKTNIFKQYKACDPDNPMCAMMECSHSVTSLRQRAVEVGAHNIVQQIDQAQTSL